MTSRRPSRFVHPWLAVLVLALVAGVAPALHAAPAEPAPSLFELEGSTVLPKAGTMHEIPEAVSAHTISVDPKLVAANPDRLEIQLPGGLFLEAKRTRFVDYGPHWKAWSGTLENDVLGAEPGYVHLGYHAEHGEQVTGLFLYGKERYRIVGGFHAPHRLVELEGNDRIACAEPRLDDLPTGLRGTLDAFPSPSDEDLAMVTKSSTRIDVMAIWPKAFFPFVLSEVDLVNEILDAIDIGNEIFTNNGIAAYYNLVHYGPIVEDQPPATGLQDALDFLTFSTSTEVEDLRDAFGADVVALYIPFIWDDDDACGAANKPHNTNQGFGSGYNLYTTGNMGDRAFSSNRHGCGFDDLTLAHEIGHNFGMNHSSTTFRDIYSFSKGEKFFVSGTEYATLMECTCTSRVDCPDISDAVCDRVKYFSDDTQTYLGVSLGDSSHRNEDVATLRKSTMAGYRPQSSNTPPTADIDISCTGNTCTFDASGSTDNATIPSTGYHWDFGDGNTGSGKITNHTYSSGSQAWVHLLVTDSGGQRGWTVDLLNY